ncbi:MAG: hypothetical protein ABI402_18635 [Ferruginibacter sp.]
MNMTQPAAFHKTSYHPAILLACYLNWLPDELLQKIPRSTKYDWLHKNLCACFGYDWYCSNKHLFTTLQEVAVNKKLLSINKALLRVIALQKFLKKYARQIHEKIYHAAATAISNIKKVQGILGQAFTLKLLQFSIRQYWQLRQKMRCKNSLLQLCTQKHPTQLSGSEVNIIKRYCEDLRFIHWPLAAVYHKCIRDGAAFFRLSTFYKYAGLLQLKRYALPHRRKNHHTGIRATAPLQLLHADVTVYRTADNIKAFIFFIQDNFSRFILQYHVALQCKAEILFDLLKKVHCNYLQPAAIENCQLMTDDGSENFGMVQEFVKNATNPTLQHIIAQKDVEFSNSMIEAANKNIKYRFLYHQHIADFNELCKYLPLAVDDFNDRPHDVLSGLSPLEALKGITVDKNKLHTNMLLAKAERILQNKKTSCCSFSFERVNQKTDHKKSNFKISMS